MDTGALSREKTLKDAFDSFWTTVLGPGEFYDSMSVKQFMDLKRVLSDINNIITLKVTKCFLLMLREHDVLDDQDIKNAIAEIDSTSANSNGYDVDFTCRDGRRLIAEVKCNIPVNRNAFGAAQQDAILKDIRQLYDTSRKTKARAGNGQKLLRFMVLLDTEGVRPAMNTIIHKAEKEGIKIAYEPKSGWNELSGDCVYIAFAPIEENAR